MFKNKNVVVTGASGGIGKAIAQTTRGAALALRLFSERLAENAYEPATGTERARQNGTITFILSMAALQSNPGEFSQSVTQASLLAVVRAGAVELAAQRIRVNAVVAARPRETYSAGHLLRRAASQGQRTDPGREQPHGFAG